MDFYAIDEYPKGNPPFETEFFFDERCKDGPTFECPKCHGTISSLTTLPPYYIELETWGRGYGDIVFGPGSEFLVSEKFKEAYQRTTLRGLAEFEPVHVIRAITHRRFKEAMPKYFKTIAQIGPTKLDIVASEIDYNTPPTCDECVMGGPDRWKRLVIDEGTWDGADIFYAYGMGAALMATQRFVDWALANDIRNLTVEPALESGRDLCPWLRTDEEP